MASQEASLLKLSATLLYLYLLIHLCSSISGEVAMIRSTLRTFGFNSFASQARRRSLRWAAFTSSSSKPVRSTPSPLKFVQDVSHGNEKKLRKPPHLVVRSMIKGPGTDNKDTTEDKFNSSLWEFPSLDNNDTIGKDIKKEKGQISSFFDAVDARMQQVQSHDRNVKRINEEATSTKNNTNHINRRKTTSIFDDLPFLATSSTSGGNSSDTSKKSIFDMFPVQQPKPPNPNAFSTEAYQEYKSSIYQITANQRFLTANKQVDIEGAKAWLLRDERQIPIHLPTLTKSNMSASDFQPEKVIEEEPTTTAEKENFVPVNKIGRKKAMKKKNLYKTNTEYLLFRDELKEQRTKFLESTNMTTSQYEVALNVLCYLGDYCAKLALTTPFEVAWEKIKEAGGVPREHYMSTFLFVVGNSGSSFVGGRFEGASILDMLGIREHIDGGRGLYGLSPPKGSSSGNTEQNKTDKVVDFPSEVATFHDLLYQPTEKSISLRVKNLVAHGNAAGAEALLDLIRPVDTDQNSLKLRTYLPVLRAYCDQGDCSAVLKLLTRMKKSPGVILEPENYVLVIATLAECGYFKKTSKAIVGAIEAGYSVECGPELLDQLVTQMADDALDITSASARRLHNAFLSAHAPEAMLSSSNLHEIPSLAAIPVNNEVAMDDELVVSRVTIDTETAVCPRTQAKLRLIMLKKEQRQEFLEKLMKLAETQYIVHNEKTKINDVDKGPLWKNNTVDAAQELKLFADFLSNREGKPFTAIVDGANVAYFGQNFEQGKFNFYQIQFLVDALESKGEYPLVILPTKYARKYFHVSSGPKARRQVLNEHESEIIRFLNDTGRLYLVPPGCLDDYYWMLASISDQTKARNNIEIDVPIDNKEGRWPGVRPMLLSNDQMRDHRLELVEPRLFRRWTSSHIVNYNFTAFVDEECVDHEIGFSAPDFFSKEIQGNPTKGGSAAWHFPVSDWDENERFCIRLAKE